MSVLSQRLCRDSASTSAQQPLSCSRRSALVGVSALVALPAPALALAETKAFTGKSGLRAQLPPAWVVASDRAGTGAKETLLFAGDFTAVDTISVRRETAPPGLEREGDADAARLLSSDEAGSVTVLMARRAGPELVVETRQRLCRGNESEGRGGVPLCEGPRGDALPFVVRHSFARFVPAGRGLVFAIRGSCLEERWAEQGALLQDAVHAIDVSGVSS